jgi:hypothetical protein
MNPAQAAIGAVHSQLERGRTGSELLTAACRYEAQGPGRGA